MSVCPSFDKHLHWVVSPCLPLDVDLGGKVNSISTRDHRVYSPTSMVLDLSSTPREQLQCSLQALDQSNQLALRWAEFFYSAAPMRFSVDIINRQ
jgi:hypothetical protein